MEVQPYDPTQEDLNPGRLSSRLSLPSGNENCSPASPVIFSCDKSGYQYSGQQRLQENGTSERPQMFHGRYRCAYCPYSSDRKYAVSRHEMIHTVKRLCTCSDCGQSFSLQRHLANHWLVHSEQKPHVCANCGQRFSLATNLTKHRREQHPADGRTALHMCGDCGKRFVRGSHLNRHMLMHTREKPHAC